MSTPVIELIAANLLTALNSVTEANSYNQTIVVKRPSRVDYKTDTPDDLDGRVYQTSAERLTGEMNSYTWRQHFDIAIVALNDKGSEVTIDTRMNQIASDIVKAVRVDGTRGGNAIHTDIGDIDFLVADDGSNSLVMIEIMVDYRVLKSDPYTKG